MGKEKADVYRLYKVEKDQIHESYIFLVNELDKKSKNYQSAKDKSIEKYFNALKKARTDYINQRKAVK